MKQKCDYCGLLFSGSGYSSDHKHHYCCYGCYLVQKILGSHGEESFVTSIVTRLGIGAFLSMNVMMISLVLYFNTASDLGISTIRSLRWMLLIISTPAMIILGSPFILTTIRDIRKWKVGTDALVAVGSFIAYAFSMINVITHDGHVYFDTATMLLLIVTIGRLMEASAKNRTSQAIFSLIDLTPKSARVLKDNEEREIPVQKIETGDLLVVRPGESVPADGIIAYGSCLIEESTFTGESQPRCCGPGDSVYGGSINCDGFITVKATTVGEDSLLAQIQAMVTHAQEEKAPIERVAERTASFFVPTIWLLAIATALYWGWFHHQPERAALSALAMLIVACPCALGIATPMATCIAIGRAAKAGVLIGSGEILERLPKVRKIFFDKTGTLTENTLTVSKSITAPEVSAEEALAWAASLENASEHSIGYAIVNAALAGGLAIGKVDDIKVVPGHGITGTVTVKDQSRTISVGSLSMLSENHELPNELLPTINNELTLTYVGWEGRIRAAIALQDNTRLEAGSTIELLKRSGISTAIISGDRKQPTERLAAEVGIDEVFSGCTPSDKAKITHDSQLATRNSQLCFIGDGINDAPALAAADVGIAIGGGADLAKRASDVTLIGNDLLRIPWVIELSKMTYRIIRQNLFWAFGYNIVAVILAFFGFVHPIIAATAMFLSSLFVIGNSMRLLKFD